MSQKKLISYLSSFVRPERWHKMQEVVHQRTNHCTVLLEDVFQAHNMSAAMRSAECFGVQTVHVIEHKNHYKEMKSVSKGASDWLTLVHHQHTQDAYAALKAEGYFIVATSPRGTSYRLHDLPVDKKIALVFGTEDTGISPYALEHADATVVIPMAGFTESFNISVSVALCLYDIVTRIQKSVPAWQLSVEQQEALLLAWLCASIRGSEHFVKKFSEQS